MADPESLSAEMVDAPDIEVDDEAYPGGADEAVEGDAPDPIESQWQSEPIRERAEREKIRHTRKLVSLYERALDGDTDARASLEADAAGRRLLNVESRISTKVQAQLPGDIAAEQAYQHWSQVRKDNPYEFTQALENPQFEDWYFRQYPDYKRRQIDAVSRQATRAGDSPIAGYFAELRSDPDNAVLTAADWDDLDPSNFDDQTPAKALAALTKAYTLAHAKRAAKARVAPEEARRQRQAAEAEGVENAIRNSAPMVQGRPASVPNLEQIVDAYTANPANPRARQAYAEAMRAAGLG